MAKNALAASWGHVRPSADGQRYSAWPAGDKPTDYYIDFTEADAESPLSAGGDWVNAIAGVGSHAALAPNRSLQTRLSDDGTTVICCETGATTEYDDSIGYVTGFPGNQRVVATVYRESGYTPSGTPSPTNHELLMELGIVSRGFNDKRSLHVGFNYAGGFFVAGFNGDLISWAAPPDGYMTSPWTAFTGLGSAPETGDQIVAELNRAAKTLKVWQVRGGTAVLVIDLQWNNTVIVTSAAQAVLNALGDGAGLGALRRVGDDAIEGALGWLNLSVSETLLGAGV